MQPTDKNPSVKHDELVHEKPPVSNHHTSKGLIGLTIILLIIGIAWFFYWFTYLRFYESTDDAYANGSMININSVMDGSVTAFYADDTDFVEEGQLLVQLDRTEFELTYKKELASLSEVILQVKKLYDSVLENQVNVKSQKTLLSKASYDFENRSRLIGSLAVSNEDFTHAKDSLAIAQLNLEQAEYQLKIAQDLAGITKPEYHPMIERQIATIKEAAYKLYHCSIYAPATGYVAQRRVDVGERITPEIDLMAVIPINYVWVDANFKETQLTYMRVGQPAVVWFDLYGSKVKYTGKVLGIASGSGSVFSLIPPQNATGNWIKIVQRLPVRISLDPETVQKYPTRLGISAEVDVDITDQDLPILAQNPVRNAIGKTKVFEIDFKETDELIAGILNAHFLDHSDD